MTILQGTGSAIKISPPDRCHLIGERINPSGKAALRRALLESNWDHLVDEARCQVDEGADLIDVNVGARGVDEVEVLPKAVRVIAEAVEVPLCIDTRVPQALEAALAVCPGRPLVNSISAENKALREILPVVSEHGFPVIALCMGQDGIPTDPEDRLRDAERALEAAVQSGIAEEDVILDPLVMTVGADDQAARIALETIRRLRAEFPNNNITGGASNVSFGMPARDVLNAHFLTAAILSGMNMPITDPTNLSLRYARLTSDIFQGRDKRTGRFMRFLRSQR